MPGQQPSYIDEHHQRIHEFAADYLDEDERDDFVDQLMERHGYQRAHHWLPPEPDGGQGGSGSGGGRAGAQGGQGGGTGAAGQGGRRKSPLFKR